MIDVNKSSFQLMTSVTIDIGSLQSLVTFVMVDNRLPKAFVQTILLQHGYCSTRPRVVADSGHCARMHIVMLMNNLVNGPKRMMAKVQSFWRVPPFTKRVIASSCEVILARSSRHSTTGTLSSGTSGSLRFSLILLHERSRSQIRLCQFSTLIDVVAESAIVSFHTLPVGVPLPIISKYFVHAVLSLDSRPRRVFHNFHFWRQNYFVYPARYFFSPSIAISDNQVLISSDEVPGHTIPIRYWVSPTLVFLICTI